MNKLTSIIAASVATVAIAVPAVAATQTGVLTDLTTLANGSIRMKMTGSSTSFFLLDSTVDPSSVYDENLHILTTAFAVDASVTITTTDCDSFGGVSWCFIDLIGY